MDIPLQVCRPKRELPVYGQTVSTEMPVLSCLDTDIKGILNHIACYGSDDALLYRLSMKLN